MLQQKIYQLEQLKKNLKKKSLHFTIETIFNVILSFFIKALLIKWVWNWTIGSISFSFDGKDVLLPTLTYWQAMGIMFLFGMLTAKLATKIRTKGKKEEIEADAKEIKDLEYQINQEIQ